MEAIDEIDNLRTKTDNCLVIDGESLQLCLDHCIDEFIEMVTLLPVVVCCRCSPTQKVCINTLLALHSILTLIMNRLISLV